MRTRLHGLVVPALAVAVFLLGVLFYMPELLPGWAPPGGDFANYVLPYAVYMSQAPSPIRAYYRKLVKQLVYGAISD